jgi:hypothetical protein
MTTIQTRPSSLGLPRKFCRGQYIQENGINMESGMGRGSSSTPMAPDTKAIGIKGLTLVRVD